MIIRSRIRTTSGRQLADWTMATTDRIGIAHALDVARLDIREEIIIETVVCLDQGDMGECAEPCCTTRPEMSDFAEPLPYDGEPF